MKKFLCLLLISAVLIGMCVGASAATVDAFGDWAAEPTSEGAYTVASYASEATAVSVPAALGDKPVTAIAPHAFLKNTVMESLTVPEPVNAIGAYAFLDCEALREVNLPSTLTQLGEAAFSGAAALSSINLEKTSITAIEAYTFDCAALTELTLPASCERIGENAFRNCAALTSVTIPRSVAEIGESAFAGCEQLTIFCEEGSYAASYAEAHEIPFSYIPHSVYPYLNGDADGDNLITVMDATRIQRMLARMATDDEENSAIRGDVDGDGLKIYDATAIQRHLAGMGNPYGIGLPVYG